MPVTNSALPADRLAFTIEEWNACVGESRSATYEALRRGDLKAKKRGRRTIILREDGEAYLAALPDYQPQKAA